MMLPQMTELPVQRSMIQVFRGYRHVQRIQDGEFYEQENMSCRHFPILAPRQRRGLVQTLTNPQGIISKDALGIVDGTKLIWNGYEIDLGLSTAAADCPKQLVSMGAYLIIFPDGVYINTEDLTDRGSISASFTTTASVTFSLCRQDGTDYTGAIASAAAPEEPEDGALWINTSSTPHTLNQYSAYSSQWVGVPTTYVKIASANIGKNFSQFDGVSITGCTAAGTDALNTSSVVWAKGDDYLVVIGILDATATQEGAVTVTRRPPLMDWVCEGENRIWGCRYGFNRAGEMVNEIYACKLGDFKNWFCYMGTATDSYAVSVGSDGKFTGAISHLGYPLFFKEECIHKIFGSYPSNYQVTTINGRGLEEGSSGSLCIVNEVLYYKSRGCVCATDGSLPLSVSDALGSVRYREASAGRLGDCYYISMLGPDNERSLFCYDTKKTVWTREDATDARLFCNHDDDLYFVDWTTKELRVVNGETASVECTQEGPVRWSATTGDMGLSNPDRKYIGKITVRVSMDEDAEFSVSVQYDGEKKWRRAATVRHGHCRSFSLPVRMQRCDRFRLMLHGIGDCRVISITKTIETGSDFA